MSEAAALKNSTSIDRSAQILRDYTTTITILEHLSDAVFILNERGVIEYANKVALDMLGLDLNKMIGKNLDEFIMARLNFDSISDHPQNGYLLDHIYRGAFQEMETSLVHQEYSTPVVISFGLVRDGQGNISYIIASAKDITIRKQLEQEMEQQQLLALSRDRYRELGELAVNMVHNLSQPVTSVRLHVELLQKQLAGGKIDPDKMQKQLQNILALLDSITGNITNVRNFAFLTEDESLKPMQVQPVLEQALQQVAYELKENDIETEVHSEKKLPQILANPLNIQQVFVSLIKFLSQEIKSNLEHVKRERSIQINIRNNRNRWLEIRIGSVTLNGFVYKSAKKQAGASIINSHLELMVVQIILTSIGGDFKVEYSAGEHPVFVLRIPYDSAKERDQLLNLIELLHQ